MDVIRASVSRGGRVVIPAEYRRALGIDEGDRVLLVLDHGEVRIVTPEAAIARAQRLVRQFVPEGTPLVATLIQDRREEAERG